MALGPARVGRKHNATRATPHTARLTHDHRFAVVVLVLDGLAVVGADSDAVAATDARHRSQLRALVSRRRSRANGERHLTSSWPP